MENRFWIAYSGGIDSHVLLHFLAAHFADYPLHAIHINHQLLPEAEAWATHCQHICAALKIPCSVIPVDISLSQRQGIEAAAREARYQAFAHVMKAGDLLFTAHHQDDQAETVLLQLLRGAGLKGLSAMPSIMPFAEGFLVRPFLKFKRHDLFIYAKANGLDWIDDHSNLSLHYDRNYLRHRLFPILQKRWPQASKTLASFAIHCAEQEALLSEYTQQDLIKIQGSYPNTINVLLLKKLTYERQAATLRQWIRQLGLPTPTRKVLKEILTSVLNAKPDAVPYVQWSNTKVHRYRNNLFAFSSTSRQTKELTAEEKTWCEQHKLKPATKNIVMQIRFRQGGEKFKPCKSRHTHELKKLFQAWSVPPWLRDQIPLIYYNEDLAAVVGYAIAEGYQEEI